MLPNRGLTRRRQLSLSTNQIDRMFPVSGMKALRILSLARNNIKKIEKLDDAAATLEELWVSYNSISSLDGVLGLPNLAVLYVANNNIKDWGEVDKLVRVFLLWQQSTTNDGQASLGNLRDVLFIGNPIYEGLEPDEARLQVIKRLPHVRVQCSSPCAGTFA